MPKKVLFSREIILDKSFELFLIGQPNNRPVQPAHRRLMVEEMR